MPRDSQIGNYHRTFMFSQLAQLALINTDYSGVLHSEKQYAAKWVHIWVPVCQAEKRMLSKFTLN